MGVVILRLPEVIKVTGLSRSGIYQLIASQQFPKQIKLGARASGWIESEILEWISKKIADRDAA